MCALRIFRGLMTACLLLGLGLSSAFALQPEEILLIANRNVSAGVELARYYQDQRSIPAENLLQIRMTNKEDCSREEYLQKMVAPIRTYLAGRPSKIRCLLLFYGLPLRVAPPKLSAAEKKIVDELTFKQKAIDWRVEHRPDAETVAQLTAESQQLQKDLDKYRRLEQGAAVDSELTLLLNDDYPLDRWQPNPYFVAFRNTKQGQLFSKEQVLLVARLDAPTPGIVRRMIDDSLLAEQRGMTGRAYFDARWPLPDKSGLHGYAFYDASLHKAAEQVRRLSKLPVTLDQQETLFQPGTAPDAALYSGWYSLGQYVAAFDWRPGAVAYHLASSECTTLKKAGSQNWCKRLLEEGVAATIGPVAEPYVQAFPVPDIFFTYLLDGYDSLVESYFLSTAFLSWQMILIGDPLYRPFRNQF